MRTRIQFIFVITVIFASVCFCGPFADENIKTDVTIYNGGFGVVKHEGNIDFAKGVNEIIFNGFGRLDPYVMSLDFGGSGEVKVIEQDFVRALNNRENLLRENVGKAIIVVVSGSGSDAGRKVSGQLVYSDGRDMVLRMDDGIEIVNLNSVESISLECAAMPLESYFRWECEAEKAGSVLSDIMYHISGLNWSADYMAVIDDDDSTLSLQGRVDIENSSGVDFEDANIKLIAGDVRKVNGPGRAPQGRMMKMSMDSMAESAGGFVESAVMDYHSYFLDRRVSLADEQSKQIEFVPVAKGVKFEKLYLYDRTKNASAVAINLELMNSEENGLGRALPGGVMRIYKKDALHGMVDFLGEDRIGHTAKNEKIEISIGNAFDIVPEYTLVKSESGRRTRTQSHKVKLSNRKDEAVTVFVEEKFGSYVNWKIDSSNYGYEVKDANTARFKITIEPDTSVDLEYTATETWQ